MKPTDTTADELRRFKTDLKRTRDALVVCRDDLRLAENVNQRELDHARALQSAAEQSADDWRASYDAQVRNTLAFEEESQRLRERVKELEAERAWYRSAVAIIAQGVCASAPDKPLSVGLDESYCGGSCFVCIARTVLTDTENETGEKE